MKDISSVKIDIREIIKKDWFREYAKRILFAILAFIIIFICLDYVKGLTVKADPYDILTARCSVTNSSIKVNVTEWAEGCEPELKKDGLSYRYDEDKRTLYISLMLSKKGSDEEYGETIIENDYKNLKKVVIEGGILNIHQRTVWDKGEEPLATKPSPTPESSSLRR